MTYIASVIDCVFASYFQDGLQNQIDRKNSWQIMCLWSSSLLPIVCISSQHMDAILYLINAVQLLWHSFGLDHVPCILLRPSSSLRVIDRKLTSSSLWRIANEQGNKVEIVFSNFTFWNLANLSRDHCSFPRDKLGLYVVFGLLHCCCLFRFLG